MKTYEPTFFDNGNPIVVHTKVTHEWSSCPLPSLEDQMRALMIIVDQK